MQASSYYLWFDEHQHGPYTVAQVSVMLDNDIVPASARYWMDGMEDWQPIAGLPVETRKKSVRKLWIALIAASFAACCVVIVHNYHDDGGAGADYGREVTLRIPYMPDEPMQLLAKPDWNDDGQYERAPSFTVAAGTHAKIVGEDDPSPVRPGHTGVRVLIEEGDQKGKTLLTERDWVQF